MVISDETVQVLFIGARDHSEFQSAVRWLEKRYRVEFVSRTTEVEQLPADFAPQFIVFGQRRPSEFQAADVENVLASYPLARALVLLGGWCEGETRTGVPLNGIPRVYWHQFESRVAAHPLHESALWQLPRTTTPAEYLSAACSDLESNHRRMLGVISATFVAFESISDICSSLHCGTVWLRAENSATVRGIEGLIWDLDGAPQDTVPRQVALGMPTIAIMGFPRQGEVARLQANANLSVISKPYVAADLAAMIKARI